MKIAWPPASIDLLGDALAVFHLDVGEDDFSAFFGKDTGFGGAHAAGCAGDDGYFVLESHLCSFWCEWSVGEEGGFETRRYGWLGAMQSGTGGSRSLFQKSDLSDELGDCMD